jgi:hypothetical protein
VEVTCRSLHSRLLFRPSPLMDHIIFGTLARARQRHQVQVCFFVGVSNHMHLLLWVEDARKLSQFVRYFLSKLAREVGRLTGWKEKIFGRRGEKFDRLQYATREVLELDPLPCWKHLTEEQRRLRVEALVEAIEIEVANRSNACSLVLLRCEEILRRRDA